ncbi:TRAP transporter substrate-binding protein [Microvirga aerophila]|uniref:ABC transporter substrate-binding protein n=1 Tax=Microvirga aerophila TaxID=670291 RepID=A0A512BVW5_9HYPH|nr:TRAP transporter substrate-binding protein [Microvirga aerophila]GEO16111.1 ABC transporter substrate-binding protein [Microvirga aerophila]
MRKSKIKLIAGFCAVAVTALLSAGNDGHAQDIKNRTLKFSFGQAKEHPMGMGAQRFSDLVSEKSGGKIKVNLFPNATLGGDNQNLSGARGGTVELTTMVTGALVPLVKEFMVFDFPFLFNNAQEAHALADGPIGKTLMDKLPEHGLVGLGIWDLGFRNLTNSKRPINKLEDIQGLKLRTLQIPIYIEVFNKLGANAVPLAFPELYTALEQKAVDGQENPVALIEATKFNEVQKYLTLTRHTYSGMPILMSKKVWDTFSADERRILEEAAFEAKAEQRKSSLAKDTESLETLKKTMQINELSADEVAKLRQIVQPVVEKYTTQVGDSFVNEVRSELNKIRERK